MKNFHKNPFDEATQVTLDLFRRYIREWLPVFIHNKNKPESERITIVDFFAGPGKDTSGKAGSPLIAVDEIRKYSDAIRKLGSNIHLELNEWAREKAASLQAVPAAKKIDPRLCSWKVENQGFEEAFARLQPTLARGSNLLLLDQQGVKFISDEVFKSLVSLRKTDFIFFTASSTWRRFESHPSLKQYFSLPKGGAKY